VHSSPIAMRGKTILFSIIHDITDTQRMRDEILKTKNRWELTFNAVPDMIAIIDDHFRIVQVNKAMADRLGVSPEQAVGLTCYEVVHHTSVPPAFCPHQLLLRDSQNHSADIHEDNLNGDFFLTVSPIRDPSGAVIGSVHVLRDISEMKRAEKKIQESEAKFREIFNSANDAIHLHEVRDDGLPGKFVDVNEVACRMLQYTREELLEKSPLDLTTDYHSRPLEQIGEEIITKGYAIFETEHRRKDGSIVPVEVSTHIIVISGRRMVLSIIRDLTRRKRDESKLRQLSADYKAIIDNAPAMIWYKDTKNNFVRVNPAAAQTFGMPVDKIEGKSSYDIFPDFTEEYYRDDLEVINSGKPKLGIIETLTAATGEHLWLQTDKIPLKDDKGTVAGVLVFAVDITERKHAEEVLRETNEYLNNLFDYANAPIIVWDPEYVIIRFNHAFEDLTHRSEQEVIGQRLDILFPEESREKSLLLIKKTLEGERWEVVEIPILVKDGSVHTVLWNSANILDNEGRIISTIAQGVDITDRIVLEQEMASHEEELRRFSGALEIVNKKLNLLSSITRHDINNQLTVLMGFLELLEMKLPDNSYSSFFNKITDAAERIQAMIQFTKTYQDIGVNAPIWQDTHTLIDAATKGVSLGGIRLINDIPAGFTVFADPLIVKVFYNLVDNAVRYGGKITIIRFYTGTLNGDCMIVCEDDGNGISAGEKEKIFERGFGKNTGLGLFLSREILSITGITIRETGEPGKGARFEMLVPQGMYR
jgi:PAS domain S-box-containing protein